MELIIVRNLINRLNQEQIKYCHWKSNQHVADAFTGIDDIDMLIDQEDLLKLNTVLNDLGYKRFKLPEKRAYIGIEDYLGFDSEKGVFVHLHLHYQLTLGEKFLKGYQLPYAKSIIKRRIFDKDQNIYISSHEDEMWLLLVRQAIKLRNRDLVKLFLKKDIFGKSTQAEYKWLQKNLKGTSFEERVINLFGNKIGELMSSIYKKELDIKKIYQLRLILQKEFKPFKSYTVIGGNISRWGRELFRIRQVMHNHIYKDIKSYRRTPISGGKIIAFLGPDGAGKTTVIHEVHKKLKPLMDVKHFYLGSGDGHSSLLRKPLKILYNFLLEKGTLSRKSRKVDNQGKTYRIGEGTNASFIRKVGQLPWTYTLNKERRNKILKANRFKSKGYVVITDRYPQTQVNDISDGPRYYLNPKFENTFINNKLVKVEKKCFNITNLVKPDIVIILKVDSEIAYKRKPDEIDIISHRNLMDTILGLEFGDNTKKVIIDANQPLEKVILAATSAVWRGL